MGNGGRGAIKGSLAAMVAQLADRKEVAGCEGTEEVYFLGRFR